jgi:hypothetical protein
LAVTPTRRDSWERKTSIVLCGKPRLRKPPLLRGISTESCQEAIQTSRASIIVSRSVAVRGGATGKDDLQPIALRADVERATFQALGPESAASSPQTFHYPGAIPQPSYSRQKLHTTASPCRSFSEAWLAGGFSSGFKRSRIDDRRIAPGLDCIEY